MSGHAYTQATSRFLAGRAHSYRC